MYRQLWPEFPWKNMNKIWLLQWPEVKWLNTWRALWDYRIPLKMKMFLWRILMQLLPIGHKLRARNISVGLCHRCLYQIEDGLHWGWTYPALRAPLNSMSRWVQHAFNLRPSWLHSLIGILIIPNPTAQWVFAVIRFTVLWECWSSRNSLVFAMVGLQSFDVNSLKSQIRYNCQNFLLINKINDGEALRVGMTLNQAA